MKRLLHWCRDYSEQWYDAHPEHPTLRRIVARWAGLMTGLMVGFAGLLLIYLTLFESPRTAAGWELAITLLCLAISAIGFVLFAWSFNMRD